MSGSHTNTINVELRRWLIASQKLRRTASISYAKIKSCISSLEVVTTKEAMDKLHDDTG